MDPPSREHAGVEVVAAVAVLFGAVAQAVTGFGFSLVSAPFLVAAYGAPTGVQLNLALSSALNVVLLAGGWRHLDRRSAARLLAPAIVVTVGVGLLVRGSRSDALTVLAGLLCLAGVVAVARGRSLHRLGGTAGALAVGSLAGAMNVVAGIAGPPVVLFGTTAGWPPQVARPTLQAFFLAINVVALATLGLPHRLPWAVVVGGLVGLALGHAAARRLAAGHVRTAVLLTAGAGSLLAVVRGLA
jgi:uncharacterized membrane protein YfcA